jgi:hypothetical protein
MSAQVHPCMWCGEPTKGTLEHILPESLGCPPDFVLKAGVCASCNNGLGHVDQALLHEFELIACLAGVPRKGGGPPAIHSWAAIAATRTASGPEWHLNAGPQVIPALGKNLAAAKPSNGISNVQFKTGDGIGKVTFDQAFGKHPKFVRAIYKVAFGALAYFEGLDAACAAKYDPVRAFVKKGEGKFRALMFTSVHEPVHCFEPPHKLAGSEYPVVPMTIFGVGFLADLDPDQKGLAHLQVTLPKSEPYIMLPPT